MWLMCNYRPENFFSESSDQVDNVNNFICQMVSLVQSLLTIYKWLIEAPSYLNKEELSSDSHSTYIWFYEIHIFLQAFLGSKNFELMQSEAK